MKQIAYLIIITTLWTSDALAQQLQKCDINVLIPISKNLGHATKQQIRDFLLTLGETCKNNAEFSQWSNELLFDLLDKQTEITLRVIEQNEKNIELEVIFNDLENPLLDRVNIKDLRQRVEKIKLSTSLKQKILKALITAEGKS
jgi:hypothetical protein